jgi:hypothetical protein
MLRRLAFFFFSFENKDLISILIQYTFPLNLYISIMALELTLAKVFDMWIIESVYILKPASEF